MKNVLNVTKKKVVAGAAVVALVTGGGFAVANTSLGDQLQDWYDNLLGNKTATIQDDMYQYGEDKARGLLPQYNNILKDGNNAITASKDAGIAEGSSQIDAAKESHLTALESQKLEILNGMEAQFDGILQNGKNTISSVVGTYEPQADSALSSTLTATGDKATKDAKSELESKANAAVSDLEKAVANAKSNLSSKVDKASADTLTELKAEIDKEADRILSEWQNTSNELVELAQGNISDAVATEVSNAKSALDNVAVGK